MLIGAFDVEIVQIVASPYQNMKILHKTIILKRRKSTKKIIHTIPNTLYTKAKK